MNILCFFCLVFVMPLFPSVYLCPVVTCWERPDLVALVCGVCLFVCLFDLIIYVPSTILQLNRDGSSWVEPVLS